MLSLPILGQFWVGGLIVLAGLLTFQASHAFRDRPAFWGL